MVQLSPICSIPYPDLVDIPNIPTHIKNFAEAVDTLAIARFANAGARDAAITSPVEGQHCYLQDEDKIYVYKSDYTGWFPYIHPRIKVKSANETLGNSTTLQDDNHIIDFSLRASASYAVRGVLFVTSPPAADFKLQLTFTVNPVSGQWGTKTSWTTNSIQQHFRTTMPTTVAINTQGSPVVEFVTIEAIFLAAASPSTLKLQWAKNNADAGTTTVFGGSWIEIFEV